MFIFSSLILEAGENLFRDFWSPFSISFDFSTERNVLKKRNRLRAVPERDSARGRYIKGAGQGSPGRIRPEVGSRFLYKKTICAEKQIKEILNGLQKSRNKFSSTSKIKPDKVNIYLGPKCNFEKLIFFLIQIIIK